MGRSLVKKKNITDATSLHDVLSAAVAASGAVWGAVVADAETAERAVRLGASWLVASHAVAISREAPAAVAGLLPYADANGAVLDMAESLLAAAGGVPVFAGVLAADRFRRMDNLLAKLRRRGYAGVQNFPSVGIASGSFRQLLESAGFGYEREIELVALAGQTGMFASGVAFTREQAEKMAAAGADMLVMHPGLSPDGLQRAWGGDGTELPRSATAAVGPAGIKPVAAAFASGGGPEIGSGVFAGMAVLYESLGAGGGKGA